jgi:hypothetical protein
MKIKSDGVRPSVVAPLFTPHSQMKDVRSMELEKFLNAFVSFSIGEEQVHKSYSDLTTSLNEKIRLIEGPLPFTLRDEIDLHNRVMRYIDSCIAQMEIMRNLLSMQYLDFPFEHFILRKYRNINHHDLYLPFKPVKSDIGLKFFVWPALNRVAEIKEKYPAWCTSASDLTLEDLIKIHHEYMLSHISKERQKFELTGLTPKFRDDYVFGEISFGMPG